MIRLLLNSRDPNLQSELSPALSGEFSLAIDSSRERVRNLVLEKKCDVVILDLDDSAPREHFDFHDELRNLGTPVVLVTGDDPEKTRELIRRGIQNYCRKPLAVPELKVVLRTAHEYANVRREV